MERIFEFTYTDPRIVDGEPNEIAGFSTTQAIQVGELLSRALSDVWVMARNQALSDYYKDSKTEVMSPEEADEWWRAQPIAKNLIAINRYFAEGISKLEAVDRSLNFDPNAPLPEE